MKEKKKFLWSKHMKCRIFDEILAEDPYSHTETDLTDCLGTAT